MVLLQLTLLGNNLDHHLSEYLNVQGSTLVRLLKHMNKLNRKGNGDAQSDWQAALNELGLTLVVTEE